ncbi:MAG: AAA family ATPase, partial [Candidatus Saccharimonadales bacterium]
MSKPFIIGISGGYGAGKTTLAKDLKTLLKSKKTIIVHSDEYFIPVDDMSIYAGVTNWDVPQSFRHKDLENDLHKLLYSGKPPQVIIIEGFLILHFPEIRKLITTSIFLKAPHNVINKRQVHDVTDHYRKKNIRHMYEKYVLPTARYVDYTIDVSSHVTKEEILVLISSILQSQLTHSITSSTSHNTKSLMIIVTGPPATGKSTFATRIAKDFSLKLLQFDVIQEKMFDDFPSLSNEEVGNIAYDQLFYMAKNLINSRKSFIVESNFDITHHEHRFQQLDNPKLQVIQILC